MWKVNINNSQGKNLDQKKAYSSLWLRQTNNLLGLIIPVHLLHIPMIYEYYVSQQLFETEINLNIMTEGIHIPDKLLR